MSDQPVPRAAGTTRRLGLSPHAAFLVLVGVLLAGVSALTWATHETYEGVTAGNGVAVLDHPVLGWAIDIRAPALTAGAVGFTELAGRIGTPVVGLLALAVLSWRRRDWTPLVLLGVGMGGSLAITVLGKNLTGRIRPPQELALPPFESSPSFPSGHTLNATVLGVLIAYLVLITAHSAVARWLAVAMCTIVPLCVGLSRVYLGQHWLTDVIAGLLIGMAWGLSVVAAHRVWLQRRGKGTREIRPV